MKIVFLYLLTYILMANTGLASIQELKASYIPKESLRSSIGQLNPDKHLHLAVSLPIRDKDQRDRLLKDIYDPNSPQYHHYLTPQEYAQRFGATSSDYNAAVDFFTKKGFKVIVSPSRLLLDIDGSVQLIETTFHTTLRLYKHPNESREFYAPDKPPTIDLDVPVSEITGLDNFITIRPVMKVKYKIQDGV